MPWTATCSARPCSWRGSIVSKKVHPRQSRLTYLPVMPRLFSAVLAVTLLSTTWATTAAEQSDLDAFMKLVVARRDDNWKKLQQYILDERQEIILNGPGNSRLWGEQRDYSWFIRDGFFVRSPIKVDGAVVGE